MQRTMRPHLLRTDAILGLGALAFVLAALLLPESAQACFVCFGGKDTEWPAAFGLGVGLLLALPPAIIGFAGFTIYRSMKRQEAERQAEAAATGKS
jgi:hypothetical protein